MKIQPNKGILLIQKHKKSQLKADIVVEESDNDKNLITATIIEGGIEEYPNGITIIIGKYSLYLLTLLGIDYYFCHIDDILGICDYEEDV